MTSSNDRNPLEAYLGYKRVPSELKFISLVKSGNEGGHTPNIDSRTVSPLEVTKAFALPNKSRNTSPLKTEASDINQTTGSLNVQAGDSPSYYS